MSQKKYSKRKNEKLLRVIVTALFALLFSLIALHNAASTAPSSSNLEDKPSTDVQELEVVTSDGSVSDVESQAWENNGEELRVDFVDVGQADFIVLDCGGEYMTIDGGNVADSQLVYSYLDSRDIEHIEHVVITHAHEDHCGGVSAILTKCTAEHVYCPVTSYSTKAFKNVVAKVEEQGLTITVPSVGDTWSLGEATVTVLGPMKQYSDTNDTSIVLRVKFGNNSFIFTGDAEAEAERDILESGADVKADVLKVGHHGSSTSTSYQWLKAVAPTYAVISSNKDDVPEYGHPHESTLSKLRDADVKVFRTDMQGTVTCVSDGNNIRFSTERNFETDTLADAGPGGGH